MFDFAPNDRKWAQIKLCGLHQIPLIAHDFRMKIIQFYAFTEIRFIFVMSIAFHSALSFAAKEVQLNSYTW